jgi:TolA-binding protein
MYKIVSAALFAGFACNLLAYDTTKIKDDSDIADELREHTGRIEEMERRLKDLESRLEAALKKIDHIFEENQKTKLRDIVSSNSPEDVIKKAEKMAQNSEVTDAVNLLEFFVQQNTTGAKARYAGMMLFYIGNYYMLQGDYETAKKRYAEGYGKNPKGKKAKETLEKLAICHEKLGEKHEQGTILEKIKQL